MGRAPLRTADRGKSIPNALHDELPNTDPAGRIPHRVSRAACKIRHAHASIGLGPRSAATLFKPALFSIADHPVTDWSDHGCNRGLPAVSSTIDVFAPALPPTGNLSLKQCHVSPG